MRRGRASRLGAGRASSGRARSGRARSERGCSVRSGRGEGEVDAGASATSEAKRAARGRERPLAGVTAIAMAPPRQGPCHPSGPGPGPPPPGAPALQGLSEPFSTQVSESAQSPRERDRALPERIGTAPARPERCRSARVWDARGGRSDPPGGPARRPQRARPAPPPAPRAFGAARRGAIRGESPGLPGARAVQLCGSGIRRTSRRCKRLPVPRVHRGPTTST